MITLIVSDIHGNLPALEMLLERRPQVDRWLCLGDTVNYGPWSNECVKIMEELPEATSLLGNHEEFYLNGDYGGKSKIGRAFFEQCHRNFTCDELIKNYPKSRKLGSFHCLHTIDEHYLFHDSEIEIECDTMIGHSHQQYLVNRSGHRLLNPGSLGQDRRFINRACYAIYDDESGKVKLEYFLYNIDLVINEMRARDYPQLCIDYYLSKDRI